MAEPVTEPVAVLFAGEAGAAAQPAGGQTPAGRADYRSGREVLVVAPRAALARARRHGGRLLLLLLLGGDLALLSVWSHLLGHRRCGGASVQGGTPAV